MRRRRGPDLPAPWATRTLAAVMAGVAVAMALTGGWPDEGTEKLLAWGADYGPRTLGGQPWRLLTSAFLHADWMHLAANLYCLVLGGSLVERLLGRGRYLAVCLLATLGASVTSVAVAPRVVAVGASGTVFGLFGVLLAFALPPRGVVLHPALRRMGVTVVWLVVIQLGYGWFADGIDNGAHVGGLVTGLVVTRLGMRGAGRAPGRGLLPAFRSAWAVAAMLVLLAGGVAQVRVDRDPGGDLDAWWEEAAALRDEGRYGDAIDRYTRILEVEPEDAETLLARGDCLLRSGLAEEAAADLTRAAAGLPGDAYALLRLGNAQALLGRYREAYETLCRCLDEEDSAEAFLARGWVEEQLGRVLEARRDFGRAREFDPDCADAAYQEALLLCTWPDEGARDPKTAERLARRALAADEDDPDRWALLALTLLRQGDAEGAGDALTESRRRGAPISTFARVVTALTLDALGQHASAEDEWEAIDWEDEGDRDRALIVLLYEAQARFPPPGTGR